jgi:hypothetical protein
MREESYEEKVVFLRFMHLHAKRELPRSAYVHAQIFLWETRTRCFYSGCFLPICVHKRLPVAAAPFLFK